MIHGIRCGGGAGRGRIGTSALRRIFTVGVVVVVAAVGISRPASAGAPSGDWAWEWVSTVDSLGRGVAGQLSATYHAIVVDADHIAWQGVDPLEGSSSGAPAPYLSTRTPSGWQVTSLAPPPSLDNQLYNLQEVSDDGATAVLLGTTAVSYGPGRDGPMRLLRRDANGRFTTLIEVPVATVPPAGALRYVGMSKDADVVVYGSTDPPPGVAVAPRLMRIYATDRAGATKVVSLDDAGQTITNCPNGIAVAPVGAPNAVSDDGETVFFNAKAGATCTGQLGLWARRGARTVSVVPPQASTSFTARIDFMGASPDGNVAYVSTGAALTPEDTNTRVDFYRADLPAGATQAVLTCVTCGIDATPNLSAASVSVNGALAFRAKEAGGGMVVYGFDGSVLRELTRGVSDQVIPSAEPELSPDGHTVLAYMTTASGVELRRVVWSGSDVPVVDCVSCRPDGLPTAVLESLGGGRLPGATSALARPQVLSSDGSTVVFGSYDQLVDGAPPAIPPADDGSTRGAVMNLYRWSSDGGPRLMYLGQTTKAVVPVGMVDDTGASVFVTLRDPVAPEAQAAGVSSMEWYVARRGGGFPLVPADVCEGDGCRLPPTPAPIVPWAGSTLPGPGNAAPPKEREPVPVGKVRVRKPKTAHGTSLTLRVKAPGAGRIKVSGSGLRSSTVKAKRGATYRVKLRLTKRARRTLERRHRVKLRATVRFAPSTGKASSARVRLTFKRAKRVRRKARASSRAVRRGTSTRSPGGSHENGNR